MTRLVARAMARHRWLRAASFVAVVVLAGCSAGSTATPNGSLPSPSIPPAATATPQTATPVPASPSPVPSMLPFQSTIFGYDATYQAGWVVKPGTAPATLDDLTSGKPEFLDHFHAEGTSPPELLATSSRLPSGMTKDRWIEAYRAPTVAAYGERCFPPQAQWTPVTIGGQAGGMYSGCNYVESEVFAGGRAYVFTFALPFGQEPTASDTATLLAFLSSVTLHPERATG